MNTVFTTEELLIVMNQRAHQLVDDFTEKHDKNIREFYHQRVEDNFINHMEGLIAMVCLVDQTVEDQQAMLNSFMSSFEFELKRSLVVMECKNFIHWTQTGEIR